MHFILESGVVYCCVPVCLPARTSSWVEVLHFPWSLVKNNNFAFQCISLVKKPPFWRDNGNTSLSLWWRKILYCFKITTLAIRGQVWIFSRGTGTTSPPKQAACQCRFNTLIAMSCVATLLSRQEMNGRKGLGNTVGSDHPQLITPQVIQVIRNNNGIVAKQNP